MLSRQESWDVYELICNICYDLEHNFELFDEVLKNTYSKIMTESEHEKNVELISELSMNCKIEIRWLIAMRKMCMLIFEDKDMKNAIKDRIRKTNEKIDYFEVYNND